jgi:hypothetical protein
MCVIVREWIKMFGMENEVFSNIWNAGTGIWNFKGKQTSSYGIPFFMYFITDILYLEYFKLQTCVLWMAEKGRSKLQINPLQRNVLSG